MGAPSSAVALLNAVIEKAMNALVVSAVHLLKVEKT